jgi:flagellar protein FlaG
MKPWLKNYPSVCRTPGARHGLWKFSVKGRPMSIEIPLNIIAGNPQGKPYTDKLVIPSRTPLVKSKEDGKSFWDESELRKAFDSIENELKYANRRLQFDINREIDRIIVKVIDSDTGEIIREIPEKEIQNLIAQIKKTIGLLYDKKI